MSIINQRFCSACGTPLVAASKFCSACGHQLISNTTPSVASATQAPALPMSTMPSVEHLQENYSAATPASSPASGTGGGRGFGFFAGPPPEADTIAKRIAWQKQYLGTKFWPMMILSGLFFGGGLIAMMSESLGQWQIEANADVLIMQSLRSPDSYSVIKQEVLWSGYHERHPAHIVKTTFNAKNGFGANLRGCYYTAFYDASSKEIGHGPASVQECDFIDQQFGQEKVLDYIISDNAFSASRS